MDPNEAAAAPEKLKMTPRTLAIVRGGPGDRASARGGPTRDAGAARAPVARCTDPRPHPPALARS